MEWYYYLLLVLLFALVIFIIGFFIYNIKNAKKLHHRRVHKKLLALANDRDYYLLCNVNLKTELKHNAHINDLLIGDKFVYVISARYYEDNLVGRGFYDESFSIKAKDGTFIRKVKNPIIMNEKRTIILQKFLGCEKKSPMFYSIVVVNNNCDVITEENNLEEYSKICKKKDVASLIKKIEKETNITPFDDQQLAKVVNRLHILSVEQNRLEESRFSQENDE